MEPHDSARCPECGHEMKRWSRDGLEAVRDSLAFVTHSYYTCGACRYVCSVDFVSGYWSGARRVATRGKMGQNEEAKEDPQE